MRRYAILFSIGLVLGGSGGFALGIFVYPYWFLADVVSRDEVTSESQRKLIATGSFAHANPSDPIHWGKGDAKVYEDLVHLASNFEVGPGPKYHVYLVPEATVTPNTAVEKTMFVDLGRLRSFKGSQNYPIPPGVDVKNYPHLVIWCEQFGVLISPAKLQHNL
ncbi:MAG TPA: DM13 domain-containing protein [Burkholderiales bacterium]|nr:DM13 domain-containing protein [Burkholderiales bacterium]